MARNKLINVIKQNPQTIILLFFIIVFAFFVPEFASKSNLMNILKQSTLVSLVACGLAIVVIGGNLDLSVGSLFTLTLVLSIGMQTKSVALAIIIPIAVSLLAGLFNGFISSNFNVNSIIVTLGTLSIFSGLALVYTKGNVQIGTYGTFYSEIAALRFYNIPFFVIFYFLLAIIYQILLKYTSFGRSLSYQGINPEAAIIAGVKVKQVTIISFMICSLSVGIAAIFMGSRLLQANTIAGVGLEFDALTAILIGGISLSGGKGNIYKAMVGVFLLAVIINALTLIGVPVEWKNVVKGILILVALGVDTIMRGKQNA